MKHVVKIVCWYATLALSAAIDMLLLGVAHHFDHRVPALGYFVVVLLTSVLSSPVWLEGVRRDLDRVVK